MKKPVKIILAAVVVLVVAGAVAVTAISPLGVAVATVGPETVRLTFTEQGSYGYDREFAVYPLVAGELLEVRVKEGDRVEPGDVIALVNASDYEYQILQLQSAVDGYNGQIYNLRLQEQQQKAEISAALDEMQGSLAVLEVEMAMNREVSDSLARQIEFQQELVFFSRRNARIAADDLEDARDNGDDYEISLARQAYNTAQATVAQNQVLLEQLHAGYVPEDLYQRQKESLQTQMDHLSTQLGASYIGGMQQFYSAQIASAQVSIRQMQEKAGQAEVTAPVAGVISGLPSADQNLVSQQVPLAMIGQEKYVEVFIPLREMEGVAVGDQVELILDKRMGEEILSGAVVLLEEEAQVKLSALGVEERKIRALIRPEGAGLKIGYDMDVRFTSAVWENAITVPKTAVFSQDGGHRVWVLEEGTLQLREIVRGVETREGYLVDGGLSPGDLVVIDAANEDLAPGKRGAALQ